MFKIKLNSYNQCIIIITLSILNSIVILTKNINIFTVNKICSKDPNLFMCYLSTYYYNNIKIIIYGIIINLILLLCILFSKKNTINKPVLSINLFLIIYFLLSLLSLLFFINFNFNYNKLMDDHNLFIDLSVLYSLTLFIYSFLFVNQFRKEYLKQLNKNFNVNIIKISYILLIIGIFNSLELYFSSPSFTLYKYIQYSIYNINYTHFIDNINIIKYGLVSYILILCLIQYTFNQNNIYLLGLLFFLIFFPTLHSILYLKYSLYIFPTIYISGIIYFIISVILFIFILYKLLRIT